MRPVLLCLLVFFSLCADAPLPPPDSFSKMETKNYWKFHHLASVGYRRDRQAFQEPQSKQSITDRNALELLLGSHVEYKHFVLYLQGGYGWLLNGHFNAAALGNGFGEPLSFGRYDLGAGYNADCSAALGLQFKLIDSSNFFFALIPFGGYKYSHLMNFVQGESRYTIPSPPVLLTPGTSGFALGRFPEPNQQDWFGPFAEARLKFLFWKNVEWLLFYQYHRPSMRSKFQEEVDLYLFNPADTAVAIELFRTQGIYKARASTKQLAGTDLKYHGSSGWNFGLHFEGSSTWTDNARYLAKRTKEQYLLAPVGVTTELFDETASIHWVCYEASMSFGYQF